MSRGSEPPNTLAALLVAALVTSVLATAGCLEDGDGGPDAGEAVPEDRETFELAISGEVEQDVNLTLEDIIGLGAEVFEATFENAVGTTETANYTGVKLSRVLGEATVSGSAEMVRLVAEDGYSAGIYLSDVTDDTYLAFKEEDEWQDLGRDGALRLVDTDLASVYWVRRISELQVTVASRLPVQGLVNNTSPLSAAYIHEHGVDVHWREDGRNRTNKGLPFEDVLDSIDPDYRWGYLVDLPWEGRSAPMAMADLLGDLDHYLIERNGAVSMIREGSMWIGPIDRINVTPGVRVVGNVGRDTCITLETIRQLPIRDVEHGGGSYRGAALEAVLAEAGYGHGMDAVEVVARDGYSAVFPFHNLTTATLAYEVDGEPLGEGEGYLRLVDSARPGNYHVGQVRVLRVFTSTPIEVTGVDGPLGWRSRVLTVDFVDANASGTVSYNDGRRDRTYPAVDWGTVLDALDLGDVDRTVNVTVRDGTVHRWTSTALLGAPESGLAVDSRGRYVAVAGPGTDVAIDVVAIELGVP